MIPFLENKKVWGFPYLKIEKLPNVVSCFLTQMKFISKLLWILLMENESFSIPHLRKIWFRQYIFKKYIKFQDFKISKFQRPKKLGAHIWDSDLRLRFETQISNFLRLRFAKKIFFQDDSIYFLIFFEVFWSIQR